MLIKQVNTLCLIGFLSLVNPAWGGESVAPARHFDPASGFVDLGLTGKQVGDVKNVYKVPVILETIPSNATINMKFVVLTSSICPASYSPTEVFLNGESIHDIDFREMNDGSKQNINIPLPEKFLKIGPNMIKIISGQCNEGLDSMQFNGVSMSIDKSSS